MGSLPSTLYAAPAYDHGLVHLIQVVKTFLPVLRRNSASISSRILRENALCTSVGT